VEAVARVPATQEAQEAAEVDTEPRWMRSRWANWVIPALVGYLFPLLITGVGAVYVYVSTINDDTLQAVLGTIISLAGLALSLSAAGWLRREQREARQRRRSMAELMMGMDGIGEEIGTIKNELKRRQEWYKERLKDDPELEDRITELWEEYRRENPLPGGWEDPETPTEKPERV
jgi:hypothetical protein